MATNDNGHLLDTAGNVAIDFVWGNLPLQPNDVRTDSVGGALLVQTVGNHQRAFSGWNGYPLYTPNSVGVGSTYVLVPNLLGITRTSATAVLSELGLVRGTETSAANTAKTVTGIARTAGSAVATLTAASHGFTTGSKVTISALANGNVEFNGTWTIANATTNTFDITSNATTVVSQSSLTGSAVGVSNTIKAQGTAAGAASVAPGATVTVTYYA
jgi:hypothetical protein